ncbi:hypothetical protein Gotur_020917 [Gossypium turneri]
MGCFEDKERDVFMLATEAQAHSIMDLDRSKPVYYVYDSVCQLLKQLIRNVGQPIRNITKSATLPGCPQCRGTCTRVYV